MKKTFILLFIALIGFVFITGQALKISNDGPETIVKVDPNSTYTYETKNVPVNTKTESSMPVKNSSTTTVEPALPNFPSNINLRNRIT